MASASIAAHSCASSVRRLSLEEQTSLGLHSIAYDIPLCPTKLDPKTGHSMVTGECELVTCEPEKGKIECKARKEKRQ